MTRRNCEIDLPTRFARRYAAAIEAFLADAIPGMTLNVLVGESYAKAPALASPFVSSSSIERNVVTLRAVDLAGVSGPCLLLEPADAFSRRLVDQEEERMKQVERHPVGGQPARVVHQQDDYSRDPYRGGSRPLHTGQPVTGSFGTYSGW
jgi:hypothetical protein